MSQLQIAQTAGAPLEPARASSREFNFAGILCGPPGCGKTTLAGTIVRQHLEAGGVVFAHDPVQQFPAFGCQVYKDADAWRAAAAAAASSGTPMPRGASIGGRDEDVTRLAIEIGEKCNRANHVRVRILKVADEMSLGSSSSTHMDRGDNELLATRRHQGIGILMNIQQPSQLIERFWSFCTDVCLFRTTRDRAAKLDALLLLEKGELERAGVAELERFHYVHVKLGEGIVNAPLQVAA